MIKALKNFFAIIQLIINIISFLTFVTIVYLLYNPHVAVKIFAGGISGLFS